MLTLAFGVSFGAIGGTQSTEYEIGLINSDSKEYPQWTEYFISNLTDVEILKIKDYGDNESAQDELIQGNLQAVLIIPEDFGLSSESYWNAPEEPRMWLNTTVQLYLDSGSLFASQVIAPIIQQILDVSVYGVQQTQFVRPIQIGNPSFIEVEQLTQFDYFVPGLFPFAVIFLIMTIAQSFTEDREKGLLRRINITPTSSSEFMTSQTISNMLTALLQVSLVFGMAFLIGYRPLGDLISVIMAFIIVMIFSLCCVGFGLITATISKSSGAATGIAFIFIMPQMFLGTFVSVGLSSIAQQIGRFTPSYYVTDALTSLFLRGAPITSTSIILDLSILLVVSVSVLILGTILFSKYGKA
jgi:ABC-type multidrug transport system permease subunit